MARIETVVDKLTGQVLQQGRIAWGIASANVVERLDYARACEIPPQTVDIAGSEKAVIGCGDPSRQLLASAGLFLGFVLGRERKLRRHHLAGAKVVDVAFLSVGDILEQRFGTFDIVAGNLAAFTGGGIFLKGDLGKVSGQMIVLVLRPALERMVVTFV